MALNGSTAEHDDHSLFAGFVRHVLIASFSGFVPER